MSLSTIGVIISFAIWWRFLGGSEIGVLSWQGFVVALVGMTLGSIAEKIIKTGKAPMHGQAIPEVDSGAPKNMINLDELPLQTKHRILTFLSEGMRSEAILALQNEEYPFEKALEIIRRLEQEKMDKDHHPKSLENQ